MEQSICILKIKKIFLFPCFKKKWAVFVKKLEEEIEGKRVFREVIKLIEKHFRVLATDHHLAIVTQLELRQSNKDIRLKINEVLKEYLSLLTILL